jgi:hypothetical protein
MHKINWVQYFVCLVGIAMLLFCNWFYTRKKEELKKMGVLLGPMLSESDEPRCVACGRILTEEEIRKYDDLCTRCYTRVRNGQALPANA